MPASKSTLAHPEKSLHMKNLLFSNQRIFLDLALLLLRVGSGLMMLSHGWPKLADFGDKLTTFKDPLGLGPAVSLQLAVFSEFFCAILLVLGLFTRLSLIPLIITMAVAAFIVHAADPFASQEKALLFLLIFVVQLLLGPGKYSIDAQLTKNQASQS